MKRLTNISIMIMLLLGLMQSVTGTAIPAYSTLWEQLRIGGGTYSVSSSFIMAEDFTLTAVASIAQVEFWNSMATPPSSIQIDFYNNTDNVPGTLITSLAITTAVTTYDPNSTPQQYRTTLTLTTPLTLDPGRYWVAIHASDPLFDWANAAPSSLPGSAAKKGDQAWTPLTWQDLAFRIIGTWSGDLTAPIVSVPQDMTVPATSSSGAVVTYVATANDDIDGLITPICIPESGSIFSLGTTPVDCTATDVAGNIGSASFTVTVSDLTPPVVTVPEDITVPATSSSGAVVTFEATAVDEVDGTLIPTCDPASGATFSVGATTVTCTATDTAGNVGSANFSVTVTSVPLALDILPETLPPATVGFSYSQQLTAVGGTPPYQWSSFGLSETPFSLLGDTGVLESTVFPTTPGVIPFTAKWIDSTAVEFSKAYSLTVSAALTFSPLPLPTGKVGETYSEVITLSGGTAPYTININSASLPEWLSNVTDTTAGTITLSGTPTTVESVTVELSAADAVGVKGAKTFTLWIGPQRAFTWSPEFPNEGEEVTFIPSSDLGSSSISWWRGDTCETYIQPYFGNAYITFNESGNHQICLSYWVNSLDGFAWDKQWVTVASVAPLPPEVNEIYIWPEPSFPGEVVSGYAEFSANGAGPFTCTVNWGDGTSDGPFAISTNSTTCEFPNHTYANVGTYTIEVSVTEEGVGTDSGSRQHDVVYYYAAEQYLWLTSNAVPTTIELEAYASAAGYTPLNFTISSSPSAGTLGTPTLTGCYSMSTESLNGAPDSPAIIAAGPNPQAMNDPIEPTQDISTMRSIDSSTDVLAAESPMLCLANVVYTPTLTDPLYVGEDFFSFTVDDGVNAASAEAYVHLWVDTNTPPVAENVEMTLSASNPSTIILTATDSDLNNLNGDRLSFIIDSNPSNGTLGPLSWPYCDTVFDENWSPIGVKCTSTVLYTPNAGTTETTDSFTFHANDSHYDSNVANISLTLRPPQTLTVNVDDDSYDGVCDVTHCSLREVVDAAVLGDIIEFNLTYPAIITLVNGQILIDKDLTIVGPGADRLAISGGAELDDAEPWLHDRVFSIGAWDQSPVNVSISGLTIRDGRAEDGGGILVNRGNTLYMEDCVIGPNNIVTYAGGGITNYDSDVTLNRCTVTENEGTGSLGGAGVTTAYGGTTTLINSTVSGNITNNYGGGIYVYDAFVKLIHTTVSGNISNANYMDPYEERGGGAGIYFDPYGGGQVELQNSIVAGNNDMTDPGLAGHEKWPDVYGNITSLGGNLIGDPTGSTNTWDASDQVGTAAQPIDPLVGALLKNAPGETLTMALLTDSPAIDAASCIAEVTVDQRGIGRPQGVACDIGAYELEQAMDEATALAWLQGNTTITGDLDALTATFPDSIPQVIVDADYVIDSRMGLAAALPTGTTVTVYREGVEVLTDITLTGVGPFWFTELFDPDVARAAFDAGYGGAVENYQIVITGPGDNSLDFDTTLKIESVISKDSYVTETVLADLDLIPVHIAAELGELKISKVFDPLTSGFVGDFVIDYDCDDGTAHDGTVNLAAGGTTTISGIPIGTQCTVTEPILPTAPEGWTFGVPSLFPESGIVTVTQTASSNITINMLPVPAEVTVTNTISRDLGELKISKVFNPLDSGFTDTFTIQYDCDDGTAHDGTVNLAAGTSQTITGIPTGTNCTITEPILPTAPIGWTFGLPTYSPESGTVTISEEISEVIVTNTVNQKLITDLSQLTSARTKCSVFASAEAVDLDRLFYTVTSKKGIDSIKSISPSDFLYYVRATLPVGATTLNITQENSYSLPVMGASVTLYDENCVRLLPQLATVTIVDGNIMINFVEGTTDRIIIAAVKYTAKPIVGQVVSKPYPFVEYVFSAALNEDLPFTDASLELENKP